jgi:hypothetical protein
VAREVNALSRFTEIQGAGNTVVAIARGGFTARARVTAACASSTTTARARLAPGRSASTIRGGPAGAGRRIRTRRRLGASAAPHRQQHCRKHHFAHSNRHAPQYWR